MKLVTITGALLAGIASPLSAQNPPVAPPLPVETSAVKVLTPAFVRSCVYIGSGGFEAQAGSGTLGTLRSPGYRRLKGADALRVRGLSVPDVAKAALGQQVIVFARFDGQSKRAVVTATLPLTPQNTARVEALVAQNPMLEWSVGPSAPRIAFGESLTIQWAIKNVSGAPLSIYTGEEATSLNLEYGGSSRSSSDALARKRPLTTRLQNGETWRYERTFKDNFPAGDVGFSWFYDGGEALKTGGPLPDDLYLEWKRGQGQTQVLPATAAQGSQLLERLKSPVWTEQRAAAEKLLLSENPADWQTLESFASHPDPQLREIAARALLRQGGDSPTLKTLLYSGTRVIWESNAGMGDFALALLAANAAEAEARQGGYTGTPYIRGAYDLTRVRDLRVGEILSTRLQSADPFAGGLNNGVALLLLLGLRENIDIDKPLPDALKTRVLAAWIAKRAGVKNPFTLAQLEAETALARKIRYNNFERGPFYDLVVPLVDDDQKLSVSASAERDQMKARIRALPPEAAPTLFQIYAWRGMDSPPEVALQLLADSGAPEAFTRLAQVAYGRNDGDARVEAIRLMAKLDPKRTSPHLEAWFKQPVELSDWSLEAPRMAAALVLAARGEKRAVPAFFAAPYERSLTFLDGKAVVQSLQAATGLNHPTLRGWRSWWEREGSKQEWK